MTEQQSAMSIVMFSVHRPFFQSPPPRSSL
jgi:hypothetical protein